MSRIYFTTPDREAELLGSERAYMGQLAARTALAVIAPSTLNSGELMSLSDGIYEMPADGWRWEQSWSTWFSVGNGRLRVGDQLVETVDLALNTLLATCSPSLALLARLHGACEIHAFIEADDASWFAGLIDDGRRENVLRAGSGWESVADLARAVADGAPGPIVTHYSVCESFPSEWIAGWTPPRDADGEENWDAWYDLPATERWALAEAGMRARLYDYRIAPDTLFGGFASGASAFDLSAAIAEARAGGSSR